MKLSDYGNKFYEVFLDGEFECLGNAVSTPNGKCLFFVEEESYVKRLLSKDEISCIICTKEIVEKIKETGANIGIAISDNPRTSLYELHNFLADNKNYANEYGVTVIGTNCQIHKTAVIPEQGVQIGNNVKIGAYVVLHPGVSIGNDVEIMSGSILGGENLISFYDSNGNRTQLKQLGKLNIGNNVIVGYNSCVMKGTFPYDSTIIGDYSMVESGVELSHNSKIGRNCVLHGQSQVCGNCEIGDGVRIAPKSIISNRKHIADYAEVDIGSVIVSNMKEREHMAGNWAVPHDKFLSWHRKKLRG